MNVAVVVLAVLLALTVGWAVTITVLYANHKLK